MPFLLARRTPHDGFGARLITLGQFWAPPAEATFHPQSVAPEAHVPLGAAMRSKKEAPSQCSGCPPFSVLYGGPRETLLEAPSKPF